MTDDHPGSAICYRHRGCRLPQCRAANTLEMNRYRQKRVRNGAKVTMYGIVGGHLLVDATKAAKQLRQLRRKLPGTRIAQLLGGMEIQNVYDIWNDRNHHVTPATAQAINSLWEDYFGEVWIEKDNRRYPVGPLIEVINRRYDSGMGAGDAWRKRIQRGKERGLSARNAEQAAIDLDMVPEEIWPDYGRQEAS